MPTVVRNSGFRVVIYTNDHDPAHVHVLKDGTETRVLLEPISLWDSDMKRKDAKKALEIVKENHDTLVAKWYEIHGSDDAIDSE